MPPTPKKQLWLVCAQRSGVRVLIPMNKLKLERSTIALIDSAPRV